MKSCSIGTSPRTHEGRLLRLFASVFFVLFVTSWFNSNCHGQAAFFDFNSIGQFTNNFGVRSRQSVGSGAVWFETNSFGVNNSGALEGVNLNSNFNTLTYLGDAFPFGTNDGATLNISAMFRGKQPPIASYGSQMQIGFLDHTNIAVLTNNFMEGNSAANWINLRSKLTGNFTNLALEAGAYLTTNNGTSFMYSNTTTPVLAVLTNSFTNWYKLSATFMRTNTTNVVIFGALDNWGANGAAFVSTLITNGPTNFYFTNALTGSFLSIGTNVVAGFQAIESAGVDNLDNFAVWMTNGAARVTRTPASQSISTFRSATFVAKADGTPPFAYTWYTNGVIVGGGATNATYTTPVQSSAASISIYVAVTNAFGGASSIGTPATLTVTADATQPNLVSVGSVDGKTIGVAFDEPVAASAANPVNYTISGGTVTAAAIRPDGRVVLTLASPITGAFTVTASGITDLAGNSLNVNSALGTVIGLTPTDIGAPLTPGSSFSSAPGEIDQTGGGLDFFNLADQGHFAGGTRIGDFDIRVRVQSLQRPKGFSVFTGRDELAQAGIVAKESFDAASKTVRTYTSVSDAGMPAGLNVIGTGLRTTFLGTATTISSSITQPAFGGYFPNTWLRLRRVNNTFSVYYATNAAGSNWIAYGTNTTVMTPVMVVGLATFPRTDELLSPASAQYRAYGDWSVAGASLAFAVNLNPTVNLTLTWPNTNASTTLTVTATNTGTIFPSNEIQFVWQRSDGLGGFTNVPGTAAQASSTPFTNSAASSFTPPNFGLLESGTQFRVIARGPGSLAATSAVTTINVTFTDVAAPLVVNSSMLLGSNVLSLIFNEPLSLSAISNAANYVITNSLGQVITITGIVLEQPGLTNNTTRVLLFTSTVLTNTTQYFVRINNLLGTNGTPIAVNTIATVPTPGTIKVEFFYNIGANLTPTDLTTQAKYLSNFADVVMWTNVFGINNVAASFVDRYNTYGGRMSAYFVPPSNGVYRFYTRGDDGYALFMNTNSFNSMDPMSKSLLCTQTVNNAGYGTTIGVQLSTNVTLLGGQPYYIEGLWKENSGGDGFTMAFRELNVTSTPATNEIADGNFFRPIVANPFWSNVVGAAAAPVRVDIFTGITGGNAVSLVTNNSKYINNTPDFSVYMPGFGYASDLLTNGGGFPSTLDNYGARLQALFMPPSNGFYRFYLRGDDDVQLFMNTNGNTGIDPAGKVSLAYLPSWRPTYTNMTVQQTFDGVTNLGVSLPVYLSNGVAYYTEVIMKENTGGDGVGMTFRWFADYLTATNTSITIYSNEVAGVGPSQGAFLRTVTNAFNPTWPYSPPVLAEIYSGIGGTAVADLQNNGKFQAGMPDNTFNVGYFGINRDLNASQFPGDNWGSRVSAYFVAPSNATYRFFIRSDDASTLFMNTNGIDAAGRVSIATLSANVATYANNTAAMSPAINLTNGQRYYMELLLKEGTGGDGASVAFFSTNAAFPFSTNSFAVPTAPAAQAVIPADFFAPITGPVTANAIAQNPSGNSFNDGQTITFSVNGVTGANPIGIQWKKNGVPIPGANAFTYTTPALSPADIGIATYSVSIFNAQSSLERSINLTVTNINVDVAPPTITAVVGNGLQNEVTVTFSENVLASTATNIANYSISGLTITAAFLRANNQIALITSQQTAGARYILVVSNVRDTSRNANIIVPGSSFAFTSWNLQRGFVTVDLFTGLNANTFVDALVGEPKFIFNTPDSTQFVPYFAFASFAPGGANFADNYGARVYGWFIAPSNGQYRFYIRSDDQSELFMNTNALNSTDPAGKVGIAGSTLACCGVTYSDTSKGPVISPNIPLNAGQLYYMEALFKEGGGGDGVEVAFREAGDPSVPPITEVIPGYFFASLGNPDLTVSFTITNNPLSQTVGVRQPVTLRVGALPIPTQLVTYQWQLLNGAVWTDINAGTNALGTNTFFNTSFTTVGTYQYRALASVPGILRTSLVAMVTVTNSAEATPTAPTLAWASVGLNGTTVTAQFSEAVTSASANNTANYSLSNNANVIYTVSSAVLGADARTVTLTITPALLPGNLTNYTLNASGIVDVDDSLSGGGSYTFYTPGGSLRYDIYYPWSPQSVTAVPLPFPGWSTTNSGTLGTNFFITSSFFTATNGAANYLENYAGRVNGFLIPPSNGLYRFFVASDDGSQLWLNTNSANGASPTGKVLIASAASANLGYFSVGNPSTTSPWIALNAGQRYYVEGLWKEGTGGDYISVAVRESSDNTLPVYAPANGSAIPSSWFGLPEALRIDPSPSLSPTFAEGATNAVLGTVIGVQAFVQWYSNGVALADGTNATYALSSPSAPLSTNWNGVNVQVIASNYLTATISNQFTITVTPDGIAPTILGAFRDSTGTNIIINFSELISTNGGPSGTNLANFVLSDGVNIISLANARLRPDGRSVIFSISPSLSLTPGTTYYVTNSNIGDRSSQTNVLGVAVATVAAQAFTSGFLAVDIYTNLSAGAGTAAQITNMWTDPRFINNAPDLQTTIGSLDFRTTNFPFINLINYGAKIYGWFVPPATAAYRFYWRSDDYSQLLMNTNGPAANGKVSIGGPVPCCIGYTAATAVMLTNGTAYYIEWDTTQGGSQEYFQATWRSFPDIATANAAGIPLAAGTPGWPAAIYPSAEVAAGANFGVYGDVPSGGALSVSNLAITLQPTPVSTNIAANTLVNFSVSATNAGANTYLFYQWQADDGFGNFTNVGPVSAFSSDYAMLGSRSNYSATFGYSTTLRVIATLPGGLSVTSSTVVVTVTNAFNFFVAGCLDGSNVVVTFDKPLDPGVAMEPSNFLVNDGAAGFAAPIRSGRSLTLPLTNRITGLFTVRVFSVPDVTGLYLTPDDGSGSFAVSGRAVDADFINDVGSAPGTTDPLVRGSAQSLAPNSLDITAGGSDIFNNADGMFFVARQVTGNFDIRARVASLTNIYRGLSDINAKAAITARATTNGNSRAMTVNVAPPMIPNWPVLGTDRAQFLFRDTVSGATTTANNIFTAFTNGISPWIRLVRSGAAFYGFFSKDGTNWTLISSRDSSLNGGAYPDTIFVGFAATSHNNVTNATPSTITANFRDIYFPNVPIVITQPVNQIAAVGSTVTLSLSVSNPANSGALTYQWRRNGTNLIGVTGATLTFNNANVSDSGTYSVLVGNDGGGVFSSNVTVTITNANPNFAPENLAAIQNTPITYAPGVLLGNDSDPEGRALSVAAVSGIFPVTFYTDFETGVPTNSTLFGIAHLTNGVGVTNSTALSLNDAAGNQSGAWIINDLVPLRSVSAFSAAFKVRLGDGSANPADGFAFCVANDLPNGTASEEGAGTGLSICFDNFDNGGLEAPALDIKWRGAILTHIPIAKIQSPGWLPVTVNLRASGLLDVTLNGLVLASNFQTPYTPITGARYGFFARTGGEFETHWLDEVSITVLTPETTLSTFSTFSYNSDFLYGLPIGMTLYGTNSYWTNQTGVGNSSVLHLNDAIGNATGAAVIDEITPNKPVNSFTASFKLRLGGGTVEPADGLSFNFANDLPNATVGSAEEGAGTGLSLCFDIYRFPDNAGTSANRSGLKLKWKGVTFAQLQIPQWTSTSYIPVVMTLNANGTLTVNVDGTNAFNNVASPFQPTRGRFGFYARTGGSTQNAWVDDLNITLPDYGYVTLSGTNVLYAPPRNACGVDTFYYQISDGQGGLVWDSASVALIDVTAPLILSCATNRTIFTTSSNCFGILPDLTVNSGLVATDSCTLTITQSPPAGTLVSLGVTPVSLYAADSGSNVVTCVLFVTNRDNVLPSITCPANLMVNTDLGFCYSTAPLGTPLTADNCSVAVVSNNAPAQLPIGTNFVTWSVIDASGNSNGCVQTVVVIDNQFPSITCPANITTNLAPGVCVVTLNPGTPLVSDNCGIASLNNNAPSQFAIGITIVTWTVTDVNGNVSSCQQSITVNESPISITSQPVGTNVLAGTAVTFNVSVTPSCSFVFYQWYRDGAPMAGQTNSTLALGGVGSCAPGSYNVISSNAVNSLTSMVAVLMVTNTPSLISPGGSLAVASQNECGLLPLVGGAAYDWELSDAAGVAGTNWDLVSVTGGIDVQATSGNPFTVNLISINGASPGVATNFDNNTTNVFIIAAATEGVTNFAANKFILNDSGFVNDLGGGAFSIEEGSIKLRFTPNHGPLANDATFNRAPNLSLKIRIADLLAGFTSDADGEARTLVSLGASTNGATITTNATHIFYTATSNVPENFSYTVRDVHSYRVGDAVRTATGLIHITVNTPGGTNANIVAITLSNNVPTIRFAGIPGYSYDVQRTTNLVPVINWTTLWTTTAPPNGIFDFTDTSAPASQSYYRTAQH